MLPDVAEVDPGRYRLGERLGEGGLGVVYEAHDPELDRTVAVKVLRPNVSANDGSRARRRLIREARAMAALTHPNVVEIYDVSSDARGMLIVMERLYGVTLGQWLLERRTVDEVLSVMEAAGRGLQAAHEAGLVHRDFKPGNVFVCDDGRVKVLDFGLARPAESDSDAPSDSGAEPPSEITGHGSGELALDVTRTGAVLGTPAYMAPEQHRGEASDARTDQFAFCATLYRALYDVLPFAGNRVDALEEAKNARRVTTPHRSVAVPGRVRSAILRGLAPFPEDRWPTMAALLGALRHRSVFARARIGAAVATLGLAALVAVPMLESTESAASTTEQQSDPPEDPSAADRERGRALARRSDTLAEQGDYEGAIAAATEQIELGTRIDDGRLRLGGLHRRGRLQLIIGRYREGAKDAAAASHVATTLGDDLSALRASAIAIYAYTEAGDYDDARRWSGFADALLDRDDLSAQSRSEALGAQGGMHRYLGELDEAARKFEAALDLALSDPDTDPFVIAGSWTNLGNVYLDAGNAEEAIRTFREAVTRNTAVSGPDHPNTATARLNLAAAYNLAERYEDAIAQYTAARAVLAATTDESSDFVAYCDLGLGQVASGQGDHRAAVEHLERARAGYLRAHGEDSRNIVKTDSLIAESLTSLGRHVEAQRIGARSVRLAEGLPGGEAGLLGPSLRSLGRAQLAAGNPEAHATLTRARAQLVEHDAAPPDIEHIDELLAQARTER